MPSHDWNPLSVVYPTTVRYEQQKGESVISPRNSTLDRNHHSSAKSLKSSMKSFSFILNQWLSKMKLLFLPRSTCHSAKFLKWNVKRIWYHVIFWHLWIEIKRKLTSMTSFIKEILKCPFQMIEMSAHCSCWKGEVIYVSPNYITKLYIRGST